LTRSNWSLLGVVLLLVSAACTRPDSAAVTTTAPSTTSTTTTIPVDPELILRFDLRLREGETTLETQLTGGPGEEVVLLGDGTGTAPTLILLDQAGNQLAAGRVDATFTDLTDLAYRFTSEEPVTVRMASTDGDRFRLRIDASAGVQPTLVDSSRAQLPTDGEFLYEAAGDVLMISTAAALDGSVALTQVDGPARFSESAVGLIRFPATRWFASAGTYRVTVIGRMGAVSISTRDTGLRTAEEVQNACSFLGAIERQQLVAGADLRPISDLIAESLTGGDIGDEWLAALQAAVLAAEPAVELLRSDFEAARDALPTYFGQDLIDVKNGIYSSWVRLRDAAGAAVSARQFFEEIATANDARLLRIGEVAGYSLDSLDAFTTQVCGFSIRSPDVGIQA
jgi:hypothetical protein